MFTSTVYCSVRVLWFKESMGRSWGWKHGRDTRSSGNGCRDGTATYWSTAQVDGDSGIPPLQEESLLCNKNASDTAHGCANSHKTGGWKNGYGTTEDVRRVKEGWSTGAVVSSGVKQRTRGRWRRRAYFHRPVLLCCVMYCTVLYCTIVSRTPCGILRMWHYFNNQMVEATIHLRTNREQAWKGECLTNSTENGHAYRSTLKKMETDSA